MLLRKPGEGHTQQTRLYCIEYFTHAINFPARPPYKIKGIINRSATIMITTIPITRWTAMTFIAAFSPPGKDCEPPSRTTLERIIRNLPNTTPGIDDISAQMLKWVLLFRNVADILNLHHRKPISRLVEDQQDCCPADGQWQVPLRSKSLSSHYFIPDSREGLGTNDPFLRSLPPSQHFSFPARLNPWPLHGLGAQLNAIAEVQ